MHDNEIVFTEPLVRGLLRAQFPHWADLPLKRLASGGASNALYRLGDDLTLRLPLMEGPGRDAVKEWRFLPRLAPHLPLPIPAPVALGEPTADYPFHWSVAPWLAGGDADSHPPGDLLQVAHDMAGFIRALQAIPVTDAPPRGKGRGGPLAPRDADVQRCLGELAGRIDTAAAAHSWQQSLDSPVFTGTPVWMHADLHPGNLLVASGRISGVIDWGSLCVGDPATELLFAWMVLDPPSRALFRELVAVDEATWLRGRGWALSMALIALPYYWHTNPVAVRIVSRALDQVLGESG